MDKVSEICIQRYRTGAAQHLRIIRCGALKIPKIYTSKDAGPDVHEICAFDKDAEHGGPQINSGRDARLCINY